MKNDGPCLEPKHLSGTSGFFLVIVLSTFQDLLAEAFASLSLQHTWLTGPVRWVSLPRSLSNLKLWRWNCQHDKEEWSFPGLECKGLTSPLSLVPFPFSCYIESSRLIKLHWMSIESPAGRTRPRNSFNFSVSYLTGKDTFCGVQCSSFGSFISFWGGSNVWCMLVDMACNGWQVAAQCAQLTLLSFLLFPKHFAQYAAGGWIIPAVLDLKCKLELWVGILSFGLKRKGSPRWKFSAVMSRQLQSKERPQIWWFKCIRTWC